MKTVADNPLPHEPSSAVPFDDLLAKILPSLNDGRPIYIVTHERPDGDAIGSQTALTRYLCNLRAMRRALPKHSAGIRSNLSSTITPKRRREQLSVPVVAFNRTKVPPAKFSRIFWKHTGIYLTILLSMMLYTLGSSAIRATFATPIPTPIRFVMPNASLAPVFARTQWYSVYTRAKRCNSCGCMKFSSVAFVCMPKVQSYFQR